MVEKRFNHSETCSTSYVDNFLNYYTFLNEISLKSFKLSI